MLTPFDWIDDGERTKHCADARRAQRHIFPSGMGNRHMCAIAKARGRANSVHHALLVNETRSAQ